MTEFEIFAFGMFIGMIITIFIALLSSIVKDMPDMRTTDKDNNNGTFKDNNKELSERNNRNSICNNGNIDLDRGNMANCKFYKNGELNNPSTIIALENIKREIPHLLSQVENDAIDKAIKNTLSVEKLNAFIDCGCRNDEW